MQEKLKNCVCRMCGSYWPSKAAKKRHIKCHLLKDRRVLCQDEASNYCEADHQIDRDGILVEEGIDMGQWFLTLSISISRTTSPTLKFLPKPVHFDLGWRFCKYSFFQRTQNWLGKCCTRRHRLLQYTSSF